jgi:hypothetical protein
LPQATSRSGMSRAVYGVGSMPWLDGHWAEPNLTLGRNFFQPSHLFLYRE